jgi:hypothetical protein
MGSFKRVLVCAPLLPEYDRESGSRRTYDLIDFLRKEDWAITFVAQHGTGDERYIKVLQQQGVATYVGVEFLTDLLLTADCFDLAIFAFWHTAEAHLPALRAMSPTTRVVVDSIDLHYLRNARRAFRNPERRAAIGLDTNFASEMKRELNTYAAADAVWTVSQKEADLINDLVGDRTLAYAVPDSEDLAPSTLPFEQRKGILFIGNFRHEPNVDAVEYLCKDIVPQLDPSILAEHPVYIVGNALDECGVRYASG